MRQKLLLLFTLLGLNSQSQTTETFETETNNSTTFTDNGQVFTITSQARGPFDIQTGYPGTGWNGSAADNVYIENSGSVGSNPQFTISSTPSFVLNNFWIYLGDNSAGINVTGTFTITGKLSGSTVYTASQTSPFNNTNLAIANGFTLIDLATFGSQNNSNKLIDEIVISASGGFTYLALDAFNWVLGSLGTNDFNKLTFRAYPNPTNGILNFVFTEDLNMELINQLGQSIKTFNITEQNKSINVQELPKGVYYLKETSKTYFQRIIIN